ncbi:hypothetical protein HDV05_000750 [Chytridiales sp. JEL 0842]|nr:hypothetical protein HDV05_000750 [Chytridiales sp. JEL 0842]
MHHSQLLKPLSGLLLIGFGLYLTISVILAFQKEPISTGGSKIIANPWALSALFDYIASLSLGVSFLVARSTVNVERISAAGRIKRVRVQEGLGCYLTATAAAMLLTFLGNPVLLFAAAWYLFQTPGAKTIREAWLVGVDDVGGPESAEKHRAGMWTWRFLITANLLAYIIVCIRALALESPSLGWASITGNVWSWVTFMDSFGGVIFSILYVVAREWGKPITLVVWVIGLLLLGNGVGCIYILAASFEANTFYEATLSPAPLHILSTGPSRSSYETVQ